MVRRCTFFLSGGSLRRAEMVFRAHGVYYPRSPTLETRKRPFSRFLFGGIEDAPAPNKPAPGSRAPLSLSLAVLLPRVLSVRPLRFRRPSSAPLSTRALLGSHALNASLGGRSGVPNFSPRPTRDRECLSPACAPVTERSFWWQKSLVSFKHGIIRHPWFNSGQGNPEKQYGPH